MAARDNATMNLESLRRLAHVVATELDQADLRVLRHRDGWPEITDATAYCVQGHHLAIRDHLRSVGTWRGVWPACVVFIDEPTVGILLHEIAHLLPAVAAKPDTLGEATPKLAALQAATVAAINSVGRVPWHGHGPDFIRRFLHLMYRARLAGAQVLLDDLHIGGWFYDLSPARSYRDALGDEPERLRGLSFAEIEAEPPPPEFLRLVEFDEAFHERVTRKK